MWGAMKSPFSTSQVNRLKAMATFYFRVVEVTQNLVEVTTGVRLTREDDFVSD